MDGDVSGRLQAGMAATGGEGPFLLRGLRAVHAPALGARLEPCALDDLAEGAARFLGCGEGLPMLVGAVPYDRAAPGALWQPADLTDRLPAAAEPVTPRRWHVEPEPDVAAYRAAVAEALTRFGPGLHKVVLSRSLRLTDSGPVDAAALLAALAVDPSVTAFSVPLPRRGRGARRLVGATPELLVSRRGRQVVSNPLAGSARRAGGEAAGRALLASDKDRREHALVVEAVADALSPLCTALRVPAMPSLQATASMWHLGTRVEGELRDDLPVTALLAALHPTPAICGLPRAPADALLRQLEGYDRGFYAGAVGWVDAAGDGDWYLALRCAEVEGDALRLFAGAGIVAGSDPRAEAEETSAKFQAILQALGIDESGNPLSRSG